MTKSYRTVISTLIFVLAAGVAMSLAFAQEDQGRSGFKKGAKATGQGVETVCETAVNYPADLLNDSVNAVGTAAKNTAGIVVDTGKAVGETVTGDFKKAPKIVTTPVVGTANTVGNAAKDTVEAPVKAGRTTREQHRARRARRNKEQKLP